MVRLQISGIHKCFDDKFCLKDVSFKVKAGEVFAFLGVNGAGKTTTIRIILGLLKSQKGSVSILGDNGVSLPKNKIGVTLENENPFENLTPFEYLGFFATLYSMESRNRKENIENALGKFGLLKRKNDRIAKFSKGMKRKLTICKALLHNPEIIFLDEPLAGIEPVARRDIKDILRDFASKGKIIFLSTHNLAEAEDFCSSFGIIENGRFIGRWNISELNKSLEDYFLEKIREVKL